MKTWKIETRKEQGLVVTKDGELVFVVAKDACLKLAVITDAVAKLNAEVK